MCTYQNTPRHIKYPDSSDQSAILNPDIRS
uniref:Uncharacterized protein n=1 Tax=Anguilla anguilla TaxID=7936 RepID=A0A0E9RGB2_ANGAN